MDEPARRTEGRRMCTKESYPHLTLAQVATAFWWGQVGVGTDAV